MIEPVPRNLTAYSVLESSRLIAADCAARTTALATISSQEKHDFVRQVTLDSSAVRVYLGLRHQPPYSETIYAWGTAVR